MNKSIFLLISIFILLLFSFFKLNSEEIPIVKFYIFYSEDCEDCHEFLEFTLPDLEEKYFLEYKLFEMNDEENFILLMDLEDQYGESKNVPEIFIGDKVVGGIEANTELENIIEEYAQTGCDFPELKVKDDEVKSKNEIPKETQKENIVSENEIEKVQSIKKEKKNEQDKKINNEPVIEKIKSIEENKQVEEKDKNETQIKESPIYIAYFFKTGCQHCDRTYYDLKQLKKKYPQTVIREYDIASQEGMKLNEALSKIYQIPEKKHLVTPMVFLGDRYLLEENARLKNIEEIIHSDISSLKIPPWEKAKPMIEKSEKSIINRFKSFGIFTIIFAGLIDGINPCAFATIIFLISYLTLLGRKGKDVLLIGGAYTFAVFITYFLIGILGLNILEVIQQLKFLSIIIKVVYVFSGIIVLIFAFYSLYDYYLFKKGRTSDMVLQLPKKIKQKIHQEIREKSKVHQYILAAFFIGFIVSLQELFCTGQVYLPTLVYMSHLMQYRNLAYFYLVIYNLLFILPLVVVFILIFWGMSSQALSKWVQNRLGLMKILMALIFLALGIILIGSVLIG
ncbi:MAG: hypothetical protein H8D22_10195 [Candidatus Cloacimonetes bacterium]|nr:hypothetical protein [Candidatus Cloacimonadota bacterium]